LKGLLIMAKKKKTQAAAAAPEEKTEAATAPEEKTEAAAAPKKKAAKKSAAKYVGQEVTIKTASGAEYQGLCVSERKTNSGSQVFVKLNGLVSRFFNAEDIVK